jgi:hypothetical protein
MHSIASSGQLVLMDGEYGLIVYDSLCDAYSTIDIFPAKTVGASREAVRRISVHGCCGVVSWEKRAWIVDLEKKVQLAQIESDSQITDVDASADGVWLAVEGKGIYLLGAGRLGSDALSRTPSTENVIKPLKVMIVPFEDDATATVKGVDAKASDRIAALMSNNDTNLNYWLNEPSVEIMERKDVEKIIRDAGIVPAYRGTIDRKTLAPLTDADVLIHGRVKVDDKGVYTITYLVQSMKSKFSAAGGGRGSDDFEEQARNAATRFTDLIRKDISAELKAQHETGLKSQNSTDQQAGNGTPK